MRTAKSSAGKEKGFLSLKKAIIFRLVEKRHTAAKPSIKTLSLILCCHTLMTAIQR